MLSYTKYTETIYKPYTKYEIGTSKSASFQHYLPHDFDS